MSEVAKNAFYFRLATKLAKAHQCVLLQP